MKIALVGHGRMNKAIEVAAKERGHEVSQIITNTQELQEALGSSKDEIDIAMEFSTREAAPANMQLLIEHGITTVAGTTGCNEAVEAMQKLADDSNVGFLWSSNFSIGVNIFWQVVAEATKRFDAFAEYDVFGHEAHHKNKADSPSGTALTTAKHILENSTRKTEIVTEKLDRTPEEHELHFSSVRGGSIPGHHKVTFDSPNNTVEITQTARGSAEFAVGAVLTAEWLHGKTGNKTMQDFLADYS